MKISEWWKLADGFRDELLALIEGFHPQYRSRYVYPITAPAAESACEEVRAQVELDTPIADAMGAFEQRDSDTLHSILQETWFGLPESESIRNLDGFFVLCDLCSEYEGTEQ